MTLAERLLQFRLRQMHYAFALICVAGSCVLFFWSANVLASPYLVSFMTAVGLSSLFGVGPGCLALITSILASDFFFIPPIFELNFDRVTWLAAANYAAALLIARMAVRFARRKYANSFFFAELTTGQAAKTLVGRLDGDMAGEMYGWALDRNLPSIPPKITIRVDDHVVGDLLPVWYRPDVGQHAFFFDLTAICPAGSSPSVDVHFQDGERLAHCPMRVRIPSPSAPRHSETVLFMHIAKSAGTAFREAAIQNYKHSEVAYIYSHAPGFLVSDLGVLPLEQRANFRFVIGHFQYGIHSLLPQNTTYITIVRDPIRRVISHFQFLLQTEIAAPPDAGLPELLVDMLERHATLNLDNLMVRAFAGVPELEVPPGAVNGAVYDRALYNLRRAFKFVGHQERASGAYEVLRKQFGWTARQSLKPVNRGDRVDDQMFESVRPAIEHFNRWDCLLYQEIQRLFPIEIAEPVTRVTQAHNTG